MATEAEFTLTYDGEALQAGLMDVRELAPAILGVGDLLQSANVVLNGERVTVSVQVKGQFRSGSFPISFVVNQGIIEVAKTFLLQHPRIVEAKEILDTLFFYGNIPIAGTASVIGFLRWLKGRKPKQSQISMNTDAGTVTITLEDQEITVSKHVFDLAEDANSRRALATMASPVTRDGIDHLDISSEGDRAERISEEDLPSLNPELGEGETLLDNTREAILEIVSLSFKPEHKWRFTDGGSRLTARIQDYRFMRAINKGDESFSKGDKILVRLRTRTFTNDSGELKSEYFVTEVIKHIFRPTQHSLLEPPTHN
ncbi:MAG: hypothetical protein ACRD18_14085 [Terriglobia bacterium]